MTPGQPMPPPPLDTLETRLVRIEAMVNHILDRLDTLSHDRLEARIAAVEKIIT